MYINIHLQTYLTVSVVLCSKLEIKLVVSPLKIDFANDKARLAWIFAFLLQFANREFFLDLEVRFLGTAICVSFGSILFW